MQNINNREDEIYLYKKNSNKIKEKIINKKKIIFKYLYFELILFSILFQIGRAHV